MNILRKNADYALRMVGNLAGSYGQGAVSVRMLAKQEEVSYQFACKILQKLQCAGFVESAMGPTGGYQLSREPKQITMLDVIEVMQGDVAINRCTKGDDNCPRQANCPVSIVLRRLQKNMDEYFGEVTLKDLCTEAEYIIMRNRLIDDMKNIFGDDQKRIAHSLAVLGYAEQIQTAEGGDPLVVKASAILHDIGIQQAELKYGSSAGKYQEIEGPPIAREILSKNEMDKAITEHICKIIANHHSAKGKNTLEFEIVWDADWLVNIPVEFPDAGREKLQNLIDKVFKTDTGRQIAIKLFLEK